MLTISIFKDIERRERTPVDIDVVAVGGEWDTAHGADFGLIFVGVVMTVAIIGPVRFDPSVTAFFEVR